MSWEHQERHYSRQRVCQKSGSDLTMVDCECLGIQRQFVVLLMSYLPPELTLAQDVLPLGATAFRWYRRYVFMRVCIYIYIYRERERDIHRSIDRYVCICVDVYIYIYIHTHTYTYIYIYIYTYTCAYLSLSLYIYIYVHVHSRSTLLLYYVIYVTAVKTQSKRWVSPSVLGGHRRFRIARSVAMSCIETCRGSAKRIPERKIEPQGCRLCYECKPVEATAKSQWARIANIRTTIESSTSSIVVVMFAHDMWCVRGLVDTQTAYMNKQLVRSSNSLHELTQTACQKPPQKCPSGIIRLNWNDAEKISVAPAQGWHSHIEKWTEASPDAVRRTKLYTHIYIYIYI